MQKLVDIVARLRSEQGCPWDRKQTHQSLTPYLLEEAWEAVEEIQAGQLGPSLCEELGDVLLQVVLHARIAQEEGRFTHQDVVEQICRKMIERHPHVFDPQHQPQSEAELKEQWHRLKAKAKQRESVLDGIPHSAPALFQSQKMSERAASLGFDWDNAQQVLEKIREELEEVEEAMAQGDQTHIEEELGDLLFAVSNLARKHKINPEFALNKTNQKFRRRFVQVEQAIEAAKAQGQSLSLDDMERHWQAAKAKERT